MSTTDEVRRIVFIGFMGAGKSTVAAAIAKELHAPLFDSDRHVLKLLNRDTMTDAFLDIQEKEIRDVEQGCISSQLNTGLLQGVEVWTLGGGAVTSKPVQEILRDNSCSVVWLDADIDVLWERVRGSDRPFAQNNRTFGSLYVQREHMYELVAHHRIDASQDVRTVVESVWEAIELDPFVADVRRSARSGVPLPVVLGHSAYLNETCGSTIADLVRARCTGIVNPTVVIAADYAVDVLAQQIVHYCERSEITVLDYSLHPFSEFHKQLSTAEQLIHGWSIAGAARDTVVIAVGGGVATDTVGFAASIYMRGLEWISVPTTITGQVDAGIGGKTGVNLSAVKNLVGATWLPWAIVVLTDVTDTLPQHEMVNGFVEVLKTAILDPSYWADFTKSDVKPTGTAAMHNMLFASYAFAEGVQRGAWSDSWRAVVASCATFKTSIVRRDLHDTGERMQLNFGHTAAHALEAATGGALSHGRAVAIGIAWALRLSELHFGLAPDLRMTFADICAQNDISLTSPLRWAEIEQYLVHDKKRTSSGQRWVLIDESGRPQTVVFESSDDLAQLWNTNMVSEGATTPTGHQVLILFGVNLGSLGQRNPEHYGTTTLPELVHNIESWARERGMTAVCRQTDDLARFLAQIRSASPSHYSSLIINPGAWTHHERALHDALELVEIPTVEVHLSDIENREEWRAESVIRDVVDHHIVGKGADGYRDALEWLSAVV